MNKIILFIFLSIISNVLHAQTTVTMRPGNLNGKDAWIWSFPPFNNVNFGESNPSNNNLNNVIRSEVWIWGTRPDTIRGLLDFDLSLIPLNAIIIDAKLSLYYFANSGFTQQVGQNSLLIQRISDNWSETGVTWNNQPKTSTLNQVTVPQSNSTTQSYLNVNVTNLIQDLIDSSITNYGLMFKMQNEVTFKGLTFASSEHPNPNLHPKLDITYTTPVGLNNVDQSKREFQIFPNPVKNILKLELNNLGPYIIEIISINGKILESINSNSKKVKINLESIESGVYLIRLYQDGKVTTKKFVKI